MTLIKTKHDKNNPYVVCNKHIATDNRVSYKAIGIWFYAFSKPEDWQFYIADLVNQHTDGRDSVRSGIKELIEAGYLHRLEERNEKSQYDGYTYYFFETPKTEEEIQKMFPKTDFPTTGIATTEERPLLSNEELNKEKNHHPAERNDGDDSLDRIGKEKPKNKATPPPDTPTYSCLHELPFKDDFKRRVMLMKNPGGRRYSESEVQRACRITAAANYRCIEAYFCDVLQNPDKYMEPLDPESLINANKQLVSDYLKKIESKPDFIQIEALNRHVELFCTNGGNPLCIAYEEKGFLQKLLNAFARYQVKLQPCIEGGK